MTEKITSWWSSPNALKEIAVVAEPKANQNSATALDIVFVYENELVKQLPDTGPKWFQTRGQWQQLYPQQFEWISLQVPPGQQVKQVTLPKRVNEAQYIVGFANYLTEQGQYPVNLTPLTQVQIRLQADRIEVVEIK
ncbi:hypothetical protein [Zooshikella harenae]|uniref:Uncharacterized protein n=1 Tax=Zooshikella harenae TaxID=2827238 RepID=A0ABS5ZD62_9GAMM|nr:hypothetical protein [Zooshikella harenae]MBU2711210.1 hypothetical protein [Zooshikella harenae]